MGHTTAQENYVFIMKFPTGIEKQVLSLLNDFKRGNIVKISGNGTQREIRYYIKDQADADSLVKELEGLDVHNFYGLESFVQ